MNYLYLLTIVIPWLPFLISMATAASLTVEPVNSVTSDSVNLLDFVICTFAIESFPQKLARYADS